MACLVVDSESPPALPITHDKSHRFNDRPTPSHHCHQGTNRSAERADRFPCHWRWRNAISDRLESPEETPHVHCCPGRLPLKGKIRLSLVVSDQQQAAAHSKFLVFPTGLEKPPIELLVFPIFQGCERRAKYGNHSRIRDQGWSRRLRKRNTSKDLPESNLFPAPTMMHPPFS